MSIPLLKTKLYIPPPYPGLVARQRLVEQLERGLQRKLTLVSAPAGFGKTTLLSQWIASSPRRVVWVSLDKGDNDPIRFLAYIFAAVQQIDENIGFAAEELLHSPQPANIEAILTSFINETTEIPEPFFLVLDDYHLITETGVHDALIFILDNLPPQMHLTLSSRANPPWPLARLRARAEILELRADDLRFTPEEAAIFLNETMGLGLHAEDVIALETRTEGWIAGLQMAAISMQGREDQTAFIKAFSGSHRFILDYLVEEVLEQQSPSIQEFLLKTSILERMTASLCDVVTDRDDSQSILTQLDKANLFLIPLDDERCWYRYHHLFSDLLHNQLILIHPEEVSILHRRASQWFEEQDFRDETIAHAFAARDYKRVTRLVEKYGMDMLHQSKYNVLLSWIEALPDELVQKRPWLCVYLSWTRHWAGRRDGGEDCLKNAEQLLDSSSFLPEEEPQVLRGYIATVRAHYALVNEDIPRVLEQSKKALQFLPAEDYFTRGSAAIALGGAYWGMGNVSSAEQAFLECASSALKGGYNFRASSAMCYVGMQQVKQARLLEAKETFREALFLSQDSGGRRFPTAGYPLVKLGELACEWNDLGQARQDIDDGVNLCTQLGHVDLMAEAFAALARVQLAQKDFIGVQETLHRTDQLSRETNLDPWALSWMDDCRVRLWLSTGKLGEALRWIEVSNLRVDDEFNYHHDLHHIILARVLVAQVNQKPSPAYLDKVMGLLVRLLAASEKAGWVHQKIEILVLQALALHACDDDDKALTALRQALRLAEPGGYIRTFIDEGAPMGELLGAAANQGIFIDYVHNLLDALENEGMPTRPAGETHSSHITQTKFIRLAEQLSGRELQVLRLLNSSLSATEIADELYIAVSTTRTHIKSIYSKLDVHSRLEAVERAQELGLL